METPTLEFLLAHMKKKEVSFHMPGHKGSAIYKRFGYDEFLNNFMDCDITEIQGADSLFQVEGILKETQERYAEIYGVKRSYLLVNGTSGGVIASILGSVPQGKKLIMARNCHKSVINALALGGIEPIYAYPDIMESYGIAGPVSPEEIDRLLVENPDAEAVILPSPNYYGICSDVEAISEVVHSHGKILIVDQAHGAHIKFFNTYWKGEKQMPQCAENSGADIVINSVHKTLASFTQSALLNVCTDRVDINYLEDRLQAVQTTSPSYLLMTSLDINQALLKYQGDLLIGEWGDNLTYFYEEVKKLKGIKVMDGLDNLDWTKLNLDMSAFGLDAIAFEKLLISKYTIYPELSTANIMMCLTGIGNKREDFQALITALKELTESLPLVAEKKKTSVEAAPCTMKSRGKLAPIPVRKKWMLLTEAEGQICATSLIPYPPGIPLVCPGERLTREDIAYILHLREQEEKVIGLTTDGRILVGGE